MRPIGGICMRKIKFSFDGRRVKAYPSSQMSMTAMAKSLALDVDSFFPSILHNFGLVAFDQLPAIIDAPIFGRIEN